MIKEALLDISKGYVKVFFDGNPVDSIYSVDGITDDESGMKKIQLTFSVKEVFFKDITGEFANFVKGDYYETSKRMAHLRQVRKRNDILRGKERRMCRSFKKGAVYK